MVKNRNKAGTMLNTTGCWSIHAVKEDGSHSAAAVKNPPSISAKLANKVSHGIR